MIRNDSSGTVPLLRPKLTLNINKKPPETLTRTLEGLNPKKEAELEARHNLVKLQEQENQEQKKQEKKDESATKKISKVEAADVDVDNASVESKTDESDKSKSELAVKSKKWLLKPDLYRKMVKEFRTDFPNCFTIPKKPLRLAMRAELIAAKPEYSSAEIGNFLRIYCGKKSYKQVLVLDAERVDLKGEVSSLVTEEQLARDKQILQYKLKN